MLAWHPPVGSNNTQFPPLWAPQRHPGYSLPYCTDTDTAILTVQIQIQLSLLYRYRYSSLLYRYRCSSPYCTDTDTPSLLYRHRYSSPYCTGTDTALLTVQIQIQLSLLYRYRYSSPYLQMGIQLSLLTDGDTAIPTLICKQIPPLHYSDFHNLMGFTSKKMPNNIL